MFEALFILTTIDAGTRSARYLLQELLGTLLPPFSNPKWIPGVILSTAIVVCAWGYLIYSGSIATIWPLFGVGNQLLATIALAISTTYLVNCGRARYAWVTVVPMVFVGITTSSAAVISVISIFWPLTHRSNTAVQGYLDSLLMISFLLAAIFLTGAAARRVWATLHGVPLPAESTGIHGDKLSSQKVSCC